MAEAVRADLINMKLSFWPVPTTSTGNNLNIKISLLAAIVPILACILWFVPGPYVREGA